MTIKIVRDTFSQTSSIGKLYINDIYFCETLEDFDRALTNILSLEDIKRIKLFGKTAIPYGKYEMIVSYSSKFKKYLPLLLNVPGFSGIRVHAGNTAVDTDGCILLGETREADKILNSRKVMTKFINIILRAARKEKIMFEITKSTTK